MTVYFQIKIANNTNTLDFSKPHKKHIYYQLKDVEGY